MKKLHRALLGNSSPFLDGRATMSHNSNPFSERLSSHTLGLLSRACFPYSYSPDITRQAMSFHDLQVLVSFCLAVPS